jgi:hypothetical protein
MFKIAVLPLLLAACASGAIWPENLGPGKRKQAAPAPLTASRLWSEFGYQESERAEFTTDSGSFTATAYRMQDPTAALAAFFWLRPASATPSALAKLAGETATDMILAHGNYVLVFEKFKPLASDLRILYEQLPRLDQSPLPALIGNLPSENLVANSQRYVTGPESLAAFFPGVPPSTAAFHFGTEAQIGSFRSSKGEMRLAIFNYPTPNIARERLPEMEKISGAVAKRAGPLVALILAPPDPDDAERLLAQVRYQPTVSWSEYVPTRRDNIGDLIITAFILIGVLLGFAVVAGLAFGAVRVLARRGNPEGEAMTTLKLGRQ